MLLRTCINLPVKFGVKTRQRRSSQYKKNNKKTHTQRKKHNNDKKNINGVKQIPKGRRVLVWQRRLYCIRLLIGSFEATTKFRAGAGRGERGGRGWGSERPLET